MPYPNGTYLQNIRGAVVWVADEFEQLYSLLMGYLSVEHNDDGTHSAITAESVSVTGPITATGDGDFGGNVVAQRDTDIEAELGDLTSVLPGVQGVSGLLIGGPSKGWVIGVRSTGAPGTGTDQEIRLWDLNHLVVNVSALRLFYYTTNGWWTLGVETGGALALGEDTSGKRLQEVHSIKVSASSGYYEHGRTVPVGEWTSVAFNAANFTGNGAMTWTLVAGDQATFAYTLNGKTMTVAFLLATTTVGGTPDVFLQIAIPGGYVAAKEMWNGLGRCSNAGVRVPATCVVTAGGSLIICERVDGAVWAAGGGNDTTVAGQISFEIQ